MDDTDTAGSNEIFRFLASTVHDMKNSISVLSGTLSGVSTGLGPYFSIEVAKMRKHRKHRKHHGALRLENGGSYGGGCFVLTLP